METIKIISDVDDQGKLQIPKGLVLKKGKVEITIKYLDGNKQETNTISYSNHYCGEILIKTMRRENLYGDDGR